MSAMPHVSSLHAAHQELKRWSQLTVEQLDAKWRDENMDKRLSDFDPSSPLNAWPAYGYVVAWGVIGDMTDDVGLGLSKAQTASLDAVWSGPFPASPRDVDGDFKKFFDDLDKFREKQPFTAVLTERICMSKLLARFLADWTHKASQIGDVHLDYPAICAARFDAESDWDVGFATIYPGMALSFYQRAASLCKHEEKKLSEKPGDEQSVASAARSQAWIAMYGPEATCEPDNDTFFGMVTAFAATLEEISASTARTSSASSIQAAIRANPFAEK